MQRVYHCDANCTRARDAYSAKRGEARTKVLKVRYQKDYTFIIDKATLVYRWESYTALTEFGHIAVVAQTHLSFIAKYRPQFQHSSQIKLAPLQCWFATLVACRSS